MKKHQTNKLDRLIGKEIGNDCPFCGSYNVVRVPYESLEKYEGGALIQDAFPMLTPDEREIILTGICADCWPK